MSGKNCISIVTVPPPSQISQRPPGTLNEKWPAFQPICLAAWVWLPCVGFGKFKLEQSSLVRRADSSESARCAFKIVY